MLMYSLIEYSDTYLKTSGKLCQYYADEPYYAGNTKGGKITVSIKYLSKFWRLLEMPLINCEINLILIWSSTYVITNSTYVGTFAITDTILYVSVVTLSILDNTKLL